MLGRLIPAGTGLPPYKRLQMIVDTGEEAEKAERAAPVPAAEVG